MATWDSADLLARCKRLSGVPSTTEFPADADWYAWITEAHAKWVSVVATIAPHVMYSAPTALSTADNKVYTFASSITPIGKVEIYDSETGRLLRPGPFWDVNADYTWEGNQLRVPNGRTRTWSNIVGRYVLAPVAVSAAAEPTLKPDFMRILVVYDAVASWAARGGMRDPTPFINMARRAWAGDPELGDTGFLGMLKNQVSFSGVEAFPVMDGDFGALSDYVDTGEGYTAL